MPAGVVDDLELIEIKEHQVGFALGARCLRHDLQSLMVGAPVEQSREFIETGVILQLLSHGATFGHVVGQQHDVLKFIVRVTHGRWEKIDAPTAAVAGHAAHLNARLHGISGGETKQKVGKALAILVENDVEQRLSILRFGLRPEKRFHGGIGVIDQPVQIDQRHANRRVLIGLMKARLDVGTQRV